MKQEARSDSVKLLFCGDFIAQNPRTIVLSDNLKKLIAECDIKCLNFEGPLPIGNSVTIPGTAILPQSMESPHWCEENGFNLISLSNNHTGDFGDTGLLKTVDAFKSASVIGAGSWEEAYTVKTMQKGRLKMGFLSVAQCEFGILNDHWTTKESVGCAWINYPELNNIITEAKRSLDYLFVITHAGIEFFDIPLPEWRDRYRQLIDSGADAVIGGHPHVPQGWELYKGKPIFYSLGNFYFDMPNKRDYFNNGLVVVLSLNDKRDFSFQVYNTLFEGKNIKIDNSEKIKLHNAETCRILANEKVYIEQVNKMCLTLWRSYEATLLRALNSDRSTFSLKEWVKYISHIFQRRKTEYRFILNYMRCESHRFAISRALKLISGVRI
ncbi:MAG TPA: CapA family protein [Bacteroidales bacterium]|nr:CapA family protein [Bacteroidales bacterium]